MYIITEKDARQQKCPPGELKDIQLKTFNSRKIQPLSTKYLVGFKFSSFHG